MLACAEGLRNTAVAGRLSVIMQTVGKWRRHFLAQRLDGLLDEHLPSAPRKISDTAVEPVLTLRLETQSREATHWSTRSTAKRCALSQSAVSGIWRPFALQPHGAETFQLSKDPLFIEKVWDIAGVYVHPSNHALMLCVDEKTQIQALDRLQVLLPMPHAKRSGAPATVCGTAPPRYSRR